MSTTETPIFDTLAREFEDQRPLIHVAHALGGDALGDPMATTHVAKVRVAATRHPERLPRRSGRSANRH